MAIKTWTGAASQFWNNASNWSPASLPTATDDLVFNNSVNSQVNSLSFTVNSIDFTGYTGAFSTSSIANVVTIAGSSDGTATGMSLRFSTGMTVTSTPQFTFTSSVGGYIYCNGKSFTTTITFNNATGVWSNQGTLTSSGNIIITAGTLTAGASITTTGGTFTLTAGTLNLGSYTHNINIFSSNNANTRTIDFGTSTFNITGSAVVVWNTSTITNLTILGTNPTINSTYSGGGVNGRQFFMGSLLEASSINLNIVAGTDPINTSGAFKSINFTGFSGLYSNINAITIYKDITLSSSQTMSGTSIITFAGTSTQTITSNGITLTSPIVINSATTTVQNSGVLTTTGALTLTAGTFNINANLTIGSASAFTFTAGTINVNNGANITCGSFSSNNSNTRVLNMGWGTWVLTSTATVWNISSTTTTGMTLNSQQSRILINNTASPSTTITFAGGGLIYYTLEYNRGAATAGVNIQGSNTFANFIDNTSTAAHSFLFTSGQTNTFYKFNVRGSAGALVTIGSGGGTAFLVKTGQGICNCDYITLLTGNTSASPANTWYRGANGTGTSTGWVGSAPPSSQSLLGTGGVG